MAFTAYEVYGNLLDFEANVFPSSRNPVLQFVPSGPALGGATMFPSAPVTADLDVDGSWTVDLVSYEDIDTPFYYYPRLTVNNGPDHQVTRDFPEWRLLVPRGGGAFTTMVLAPPNPLHFFFGTTAEKNAASTANLATAGAYFYVTDATPGTPNLFIGDGMHYIPAAEFLLANDPIFKSILDNTESSSYNRVLQIAQTTYNPNQYRDYDIGTNINAAVPSDLLPGQKLRWHYVSDNVDEYPTHYRTGDMASRQSTTAQWLPTALGSALEFWYDPSYGAPANGADYVSLTDRSGKGRTLTPLSVSGSVNDIPYFSNTGINGTPAMVFPGVSGLGSGALSVSLGTGAVTLFLNAQLVGSTGTTQGLTNGPGTSATPTFTVAVTDTGSAIDKWAFGRGTNITSATAANTSPHSIMAIFDGANSYLYVDDFTTPIASGNAGATAITAYRLGMKTTAGGMGGGKLGQVFGMSGTPTTDQRTHARTWLFNRRGVSV